MRAFSGFPESRKATSRTRGGLGVDFESCVRLTIINMPQKTQPVSDRRTFSTFAQLEICPTPYQQCISFKSSEDRMSVTLILPRWDHLLVTALSLSWYIYVQGCCPAKPLSQSSFYLPQPQFTSSQHITPRPSFVHSPTFQSH